MACTPTWLWIADSRFFSIDAGSTLHMCPDPSTWNGDSNFSEISPKRVRQGPRFRVPGIWSLLERLHHDRVEPGIDLRILLPGRRDVLKHRLLVDFHHVSAVVLASPRHHLAPT